MAILSKIRERSIFLILVIGMALFAFVISGVIDGNSQNNSSSDPIGIINEEEIESDFFVKWWSKQKERIISLTSNL